MERWNRTWEEIEGRRGTEERMKDMEMKEIEEGNVCALREVSGAYKRGGL